MAVFMRNVLHADPSIATNVFWNYFLVTFREIFLAGRWTEVYKTNTAEWDANIVLTLADCAVSAATPRRITSATGGFTGKQGFGITSLAINDNNRGVFRIAKVIDDNTIDIETACQPPDGWTTETGISARIFNWGKTDVLTAGTILVMAPPSGTNEIYIMGSGYNATLYAYPDRYQSGAGHPTNSLAFGVATSEEQCLFNAYFSGSDALLYFFTDVANTLSTLIIGELDDTEAGDTYPGFITAFYNGCDPFTIASLGRLQMIDSTVLTTKLAFELVDITTGSDTLVSSTHGYQYFQAARASNGKALLRKNWVYEGTASGGFVRGRIPHYRTTNRNWENYRPMSAARTWLHLQSGLVVPMNGVNDTLPMLKPSV